MKKGIVLSLLDLVTMTKMLWRILYMLLICIQFFVFTTNTALFFLFTYIYIYKIVAYHIYNFFI